MSQHPLRAIIAGMTFKRLAPFGLLALAACVPQPAAPPAPTPPPRPVERPAPPPPPPSANWMDAPQTPGEWSYGGGRASYGAAQGTVFSLNCDRGAGRITLARAGSAAGRVSMRVLTETTSRVLDAAPDGGNVAAVLPARDPLLDAMAFSKGRFAVEVAGLPTLYLPSWIEVSRVIEDCR